MPARPQARLIWALACAALLASSLTRPGHAQPASPVAPASEASWSFRIESARARLKDGDYDDAIATLKPLIDRKGPAPDSLRDAYLLLIKTYVFIGNENRFKPQGREVSNLNYQEARKRIAECLSIRSLRHTRAVPDSEYPPEMIAAFAEVRGSMFGSFRVVGLQPPGAEVRLDSDVLPPGERGEVGDADLTVGPHQVTVRALGYNPIAETVSISPGATLERPYRLTRRRGLRWYATASTAAVAVVIGAFTIGKGGGSSAAAALKPLPSAPLPPP